MGRGTVKLWNAREQNYRLFIGKIIECLKVKIIYCAKVKLWNSQQLNNKMRNRKILDYATEKLCSVLFNGEIEKLLAVKV